MKRMVSVSASGFSITWPSSFYVNKYNEYGLSCKIKGKKLGLLKDKYLLELEGSEEDIKLFLGFLKFEGFKIH